jgi:lysyl-tRNA synthetase class 2
MTEESTDAPDATEARTFDIPYRFEVDSTAAGLQAEHGELEDGEETGVIATVAGRLMLKRDQGKIVFGVVQDGTGRIQIFAPAKTTPDFEDFTKLSLGDWIGVTGEVIKTRRGELSIRPSAWTMLAPTRRPFPDKWHGITDPDTRYRQRYVDMWVSEESNAALRARSRIMSLTRRWLEDRAFMEVETPIFHSIASGAMARPFTTHHNALDIDLFLRIAPELYLKRLTVGGFERVFEIGRVFRNEGISTRHNPEFTMLELYWAYADYTDIMELVEQLVSHLALEICGTTTIDYDGRELELAAPWKRASMTELIAEHTGLTLSVDMDRDELAAIAREQSVEVKDHYGPGKLILEIYEKTTESQLWGPVFVTDYPKEVSPLSRDHREHPGLTERFEAIVAGRELCNAFSELIDPDEQLARFEDQEADRAAGDAEAMGMDLDYIRALEYGMPPTGGLGIGMDRLVMLLTGSTTIRDVVLFPTLRPEQVHDGDGDAADDDAETQPA